MVWKWSKSFKNDVHDHTRIDHRHDSAPIRLGSNVSITWKRDNPVIPCFCNFRRFLKNPVLFSCRQARIDIIKNWKSLHQSLRPKSSNCLVFGDNFSFDIRQKILLPCKISRWTLSDFGTKWLVKNTIVIMSETKYCSFQFYCFT